MKTKKKQTHGFMILCLLLGGLFFTLSSSGQTTLPTIFNDHMVLQQEDTVAIWGTDVPNVSLSLSTSWGEKLTTNSNNEGKWRFALATPKTDCQSQWLKIKGTTEVEFDDVLLGEVWLCSGQSNMEYPLEGWNNQPIRDYNKLMLDTDYKDIRLYKIEKSFNQEPQIDVKDALWKVAEMNTVHDFSAVAFLYAKKLHNALKVPVGVIQSAWGGSMVEAWMSKSSLQKNFPEYRWSDIDFKSERTNHCPYTIYNAMIHPIIGYGIKGFLWYQGESNRHWPTEYKELFPAMIQQWRDEWGQGDLPFYYVQIAPYIYDTKVNSAYLREAQMQTLDKLPNLGMACVMDLGEEYCIHPSHKDEVAERLSYWALNHDYGMNYIACCGPVYDSMKETTKGQIIVSLKGNYKGLCTFGGTLKGFEIAGVDKKFYPAKTAIIYGKSQVMVSSSEVPHPVAVRYCFKNWTVGTLFNGAGLPASSFRTDQWFVK